MTTLLLSMVILGAAVGLLSLRILLVRGGEFRGTCASNNPYLRNDLGECPGCGKTDEAECGQSNAARVLERLLGSGQRKAG